MEKIRNLSDPIMQSKDRHNSQRDLAGPPPEVIKILKEQDAEMVNIIGWFPTPKLDNSDNKFSKVELETERGVDAFKMMESLLGNPILKQTLRTMDLLNGCLHQCDTCLADSPRSTKMMTAKSLDKLFSDSKFIDMLQRDSLRIGSSGDLLDHPEAIGILKMILKKTQVLEDQQLAIGKHHKIKIFTNYRPNTEKQLDLLIKIAKQHSDRLDVVISLPLNKSDVINKKFDQFVCSRPDVFGKVPSKAIPEEGLIRHGNLWYLKDHPVKNVSIQDVRHIRRLFMSGRVLPNDVLDDKIPEYDRVGHSNFYYRGLSKTYMNADGLWSMIYVTSKESHTNRAFTPITPYNVDALSRVPYHPDFPTPPNWLGGRGSSKEGLEIEKAVEQTKNQSSKPLNILRRGE